MKALFRLSVTACLLLMLASCAASPTTVSTTAATTTAVSATTTKTTTSMPVTTTPTTLTTIATTKTTMAPTAPATVKTATMLVTIFPPVNTVEPTATFPLPTTSVAPTTLKPPVTTLSPTATIPPTSVVIKPEWLPPDLEVIEPFQLFIMRDPSTGHRWLFFDTTIINIGTGPLEMRGAFDEAAGKVRAIQRIYTGRNTYEEVLAGYFIYHPLHDHWHFEGFSIFELYAADGRTLIASSDKQSFCMMDTARLTSPPAGSPVAPQYPECDPVVQGLSVGWADIYDTTLPGQQIDIQDLPDGRYVIRQTVDPLDNIIESNEDNNFIEYTVQVAGTRIIVIPQP